MKPPAPVTQMRSFLLGQYGSNGYLARALVARYSLLIRTMVAVAGWLVGPGGMWLWLAGPGTRVDPPAPRTG